MKALGLLLGSDVVGIKVAAALASLFLSLGAARLAGVLTGDSRAELAAMIFGAVPFAHKFFLVEFVSNLFGLALALWFASAVSLRGMGHGRPYC